MGGDRAGPGGPKYLPGDPRRGAATIGAVQRADPMLGRGDMDGAAEWRRIVRGGGGGDMEE